jgi:transcriptional repressor NrdR
MKCPHCGKSKSRVIDTAHESDGSTYRRRECQACHQRFSTVERVMVSRLQVRKGDGRREPFDRDKLLDSIRLSCAKRPIASEVLEGLVDRIEAQVTALNKSEVSSKIIGDKVIAGLKDIDQVAYIRYAIVYLGLSDIEAVRQEIDRILAPSRARMAQ